VLRTSGARPLWAELRREITERRTRIVMRLRAHQAWLDRRRAVLEHVPAERIVGETALTEEADHRVRSEVAQSIAELNGLVRHHNLVVTASSIHVPIATLESLLEVAARG
jgi:hypothetical protein